MCMIRCRPGNFVYSKEEFEVMKEEMVVLREAGASGFVFGILTRDNTLDVDRMKELLQLAGSLPCTLHRVFDLTANWRLALAAASRLGFKTILTSGQKATALEGAATLGEVVLAGKEAGIDILIGSGVNSRSLPELISKTGGSNYHGSASIVLPSTLPPPPFAMGSAETEMLRETSSEEVKAMKDCMKAIERE